MTNYNQNNLAVQQKDDAEYHRVGKSLIDMLKDKDPTSWIIAAQRLGTLKYGPSVEPLIGLFRVEDSRYKTASRFELKDARSAAAYALGQIGGQRAVEELRSLIHQRHTLNPFEMCILESAILGYGASAGKNGVEDIIPLLDEKSWVVRNSAATALGKIGDDRAVNSLIDRLKDQSEEVAKSSAKALEELGYKRSM